MVMARSNSRTRPPLSANTGMPYSTLSCLRCRDPVKQTTFSPIAAMHGWRFRSCDALLNLRFDVLVQAKEIRRIILLFDGHESLIVGTERGFYRIFALFSEVIQIVRIARERTYRIGRSSSPFDMELRLSWLRPLREED